VTFSYAGCELAALASPQPKGRAPIRCKAPPESVIAARAAAVWAAMGRQVAEAKAMSQKAASAKADAQIAKGALQKAASAREAHQERKTPAAKAPAPMQGIPEDDGYYSTWPIPEVASAPTWASAPFSAPSAHPAVPASASPAPAVAPAASKAPPPRLEVKDPPPRLQVKAPPPHLTAKAPPPQLTTPVSASATSALSQQVSSASAASDARADDRLVRLTLHPKARDMMQNQERATELRLEERRLTERLQEQEQILLTKLGSDLEEQRAIAQSFLTAQASAAAKASATAASAKAAAVEARHRQATELHATSVRDAAVATALHAKQIDAAASASAAQAKAASAKAKAAPVFGATDMRLRQLTEQSADFTHVRHGPDSQQAPAAGTQPAPEPEPELEAAQPTPALRAARPAPEPTPQPSASASASASASDAPKRNLDPAMDPNLWRPTRNLDPAMDPNLWRPTRPSGVADKSPPASGAGVLVPARATFTAATAVDQPAWGAWRVQPPNRTSHQPNQH
jgi:hypothetical protein